MNAVEFVRAIEAVVRDAAVVDTLSNVRHPPGRRPAQELLKLSAWYNRLDPQDQVMVKQMLEVVAQHVAFGFFAVLDGARAVEGAGSPKGYFELRYITGDQEEILSGPSGAVLHELLE